MLPELDNYDWECAFAEANRGGFTTVPPDARVSTSPFEREDVAEIIALVNGENDGPSWLGAFRMKDGRFVVLEASCDYTGWDCQASGSIVFAATREDLIRFGLSQGERERLGLTLPEEQDA